MAVYKGTQPIAEIDIKVARAEETVIMPLTATHNGTYQIEPGIDGYGPVTVSVPETPPPVIEAKSITQNGTYTAPSGTDGYSPVTVNVPTGTARSASDVTVSGKNVTVPSGLYSSNVTKSVTDGTINLATPTIDSSGKVTASATLSKAGWISSAPSSKTLQLTTQEAQTITPSLSQQTIASGRYLTGTQTVAPITKELLQTLDGNFLAQNIISGVSMFGLAGMHPNVKLVTGTNITVPSSPGFSFTVTHNLGSIPKLAMYLKQTPFTPANYEGGDSISNYFGVSVAGWYSLMSYGFWEYTGDNRMSFTISDTVQQTLSTTDRSKKYAAINATTTTVEFMTNIRVSGLTNIKWLVAYWE